MESKEKKKKQLLLVMPLLILPFLALAFYALGGGKGQSLTGGIEILKGINTEMPGAQLKNESPLDKLSLYEQAKRDSVKTVNHFEENLGNKGNHSRNLDVPSLTNRTDPNEQRISEKLAQIDQEINRPLQPVSPPVYVPETGRPDTSIDGDVSRLEKLMDSMEQGKTEDPEMEQLSGILDKILAIQRTGQVQYQPADGLPATLVKDSLFRAIPAVIAENQKAVQGATIKLRLLDSVWLNGQLIPKGHYIFGTCRITNQRLLLDIKNIRLGTSIIPVDLSVYSLDGMPGLYAPEAELADAAGSGADDAVRSIGMYGMDNSIASQVADAGIDAAKSLFSKTIKKIKVKLDSGQPVLLRNNQQKIR